LLARALRESPILSLENECSNVKERVQVAVTRHMHSMRVTPANCPALGVRGRRIIRPTARSSPLA
jgi:hypothetical protein